MINGIGVVGWGVGGIEAEAAMLGQPVYLLTPDVVGFELTGRLREGCTATDLVLTVTEILRKQKVVGKFVEFFGEGTRTPGGAGPRHHRQHGARVRRDDGLLPGGRDARSNTSRAPAAPRTRSRPSRPISGRRACSACRCAGEIDYSQVVRLDLGDVTPSLAGPKRPQDRIEIGKVASQFAALFSKPPTENGFNQPAEMLHDAPPGALSGEQPDPKVPANPPTPPAAPRFEMEMEANKPTLASAHVRVTVPGDGRAKTSPSATATC